MTSGINVSDWEMIFDMLSRIKRLRWCKTSLIYKHANNTKRQKPLLDRMEKWGLVERLNGDDYGRMRSYHVTVKGAHVLVMLTELLEMLKN